MDNTIILLKHAKTQVDKQIAVSNWNLTDEGLQFIIELLSDHAFQNLDVIISSSELKAIRTAEVFSLKFNLDISTFDNLRELNRDNGQWLDTVEEYNTNVKLCFANSNKSINDWESADDALERFQNCINKIDSEYNSKTILIVAHGLVISLYFSHLLNDFKETYIRWLNFNFGSYGIVKNNSIIKDII